MKPKNIFCATLAAVVFCTAFVGTTASAQQKAYDSLSQLIEDVASPSRARQIERMAEVSRYYPPMHGSGFPTAHQLREYATCLVDAAHDHVERQNGQAQFSINEYYHLMHKYVKNHDIPRRNMTNMQEMNVYFNVIGHCHDSLNAPQGVIQLFKEVDRANRQKYGF